MRQLLAVHRAIMVVDVEGFGDPARTNLDQLAVREALYEALARAFAESGIGWGSFVSEDRGDGALILIPPGIPRPTRQPGTRETRYPSAWLAGRPDEGNDDGRGTGLLHLTRHECASIFRDPAVVA